MYQGQLSLFQAFACVQTYRVCQNPEGKTKKQDKVQIEVLQRRLNHRLIEVMQTWSLHLLFESLIFYTLSKTRNPFCKELGKFGIEQLVLKRARWKENDSSSWPPNLRLYLFLCGISLCQNAVKSLLAFMFVSIALCMLCLLPVIENRKTCLAG